MNTLPGEPGSCRSAPHAFLGLFREIVTLVFGQYKLDRADKLGGRILFAAGNSAFLDRMYPLWCIVP